MLNLEANEIIESGMEANSLKDIFEDIFTINETEYAPPMEVQNAEIAETFLEIKELDYDVWKMLTPDERVDVLNRFESEVATIEHRDVLPVEADELGNATYGQYSVSENKIFINKDLIASDSKEAYLETLDTYFHEGRHAYQFYNILHERTEPSDELFDAWRVNLNVLGYNSGDYGFFGSEEYYTQPVELDARYFAEKQMNAIDLR